MLIKVTNQISARSSMSYQIHNSLILLPFDCTQSEALTVSLY